MCACFLEQSTVNFVDLDDGQIREVFVPSHLVHADFSEPLVVCPALVQLCHKTIDARNQLGGTGSHVVAEQSLEGQTMMEA